MYIFHKNTSFDLIEVASSDILFEHNGSHKKVYQTISNKSSIKSLDS